MTRTDTNQNSAAVMLRRRRASRRRSTARSARIERITKEEQLRVRQDLVQSERAVPGLYLG
jgi:hypothetical protein